MRQDCGISHKINQYYKLFGSISRSWQRRSSKPSGFRIMRNGIITGTTATFHQPLPSWIYRKIILSPGSSSLATKWIPTIFEDKVWQRLSDSGRRDRENKFYCQFFIISRRIPNEYKPPWKWLEVTISLSYRVEKSVSEYDVHCPWQESHPLCIETVSDGGFNESSDTEVASVSRTKAILRPLDTALLRWMHIERHSVNYGAASLADP